MSSTTSFSRKDIRRSIASDDGATLIWQNLCVSAKTKNSYRTIVHDVSGILLPGSLVALMGPSGAGKSTLMAALAHRSSANTTVSGEILFNGQQTGPFMYNTTGYLYQDELFCGALTVSEHLHLMARLKLGPTLSTDERTWLINDLLVKTGLQKCYHTRIGESDEGKTLSGGEKKRLAFAVELLSRPKILFCDEPTTGLDSYSANQLVQIMRGLTMSGTSVLCTIHQPSDELFYLFDSVILMANGRVGFMGRPHEAIKFFDHLGMPRPESCTTADFFIKCLSYGSKNKSIQTDLDPDAICDQYLKSETFHQQELLICSEKILSSNGYRTNWSRHKNPRDHNWFYTLRCLMSRNFLQARRNPRLQFSQLVQRIIIALLVGMCFDSSIDVTQEGAQAVQGIIFLIVSENTFLPMYSILSVFPESFPLLLREHKANLYGTVQFYIAKIVTMLPFVLLESSAFILIVYKLAHLRPTLLGLLCTLSTSVLVMNISLACGCFFSTVFPSVPMAMSYLVPFDYILMITSGIFIRIRTIPKLLRWMPFMSWMMFATEAISIAQWDGIEELECEGIPERACLHDGDDVLSQYSFRSDNLRWDFAALIVQYFLYHALAILFLCKRVNKS